VQACTLHGTEVTGVLLFSLNGQRLGGRQHNMSALRRHISTARALRSYVIVYMTSNGIPFLQSAFVSGVGFSGSADRRIASLPTFKSSLKSVDFLSYLKRTV